jgi:type II secretory pathway pseudopilin PulG
MELLVVMTIVAVLAVTAFFGSVRLIEGSRKVQCLAQFRDFEIGLKMFEQDYQKPPVPESKQWDGWDTIYGDPGGFYPNGFLVAALMGESKDFNYRGETFRVSDVNRREENYITFPFRADKKNGVGPDGMLYDPWGRQIIVAVNGFAARNPALPLVAFRNGSGDRKLHTWNLAKYTDTEPTEQSYVFWSYGRDGKKGKGAPNLADLVPYTGSDDIVSWR